RPHHQIYDNSTSRAAPLERKCGYSIPYPITSKGNQMFVEFEFDSSDTYLRFQASWEAVCGGALSGDNGIITSPNYPNPYLNLERCFWSIAVEPGKVVRLTFHEFQVEAHPRCDFDWVL
ncbi:hypothetical protein EGW08_023753, partial [Elysia chlorotica]